MSMNMDDHMMMSGSNTSTRSVRPKCGRWNPTAEQVKVLTDLFSSGLRTPTTEQIQTISSHLSFFGNIESKNVFYWFQNHKARESHHKKRRRGGEGADLCSSRAPDQYKKEVRSCARETHEQEVINAWERKDRDIETLELFPLMSSNSNYNLEGISAAEKWRASTVWKEWREMPPFMMFEADENEPVPLDLRLSFL